MPFSTRESNPQEVFGPTSSDGYFFANFYRFLVDVEVGASKQRDANYLFEQMLSCLEDPNVSAFRRIVSRVAIAYIGMIYKLQGYTYAALKELAQECLNMLKNIEIRCNSNFYRRVFAKHQEMATDLRNHYEKKMCIFNLLDWSARNLGVFGDPKWVEEESEDGLEETNELLMRQTI